MSFDDQILREPDTGVVLDLSVAPTWHHPGLPAAVAAMQAIEAGTVANADEGRRVGHYWLRAPDLAPDDAIGGDIRGAWSAIADLELGPHDDVLVVGIGGSALGPALVADCLAAVADTAQLHFLDNTDPDGFCRVLARLDPARTLVVVVSKSGGTVETRNGMLAAMAWAHGAGVNFADHAVAVTGAGSRLDRLAAGLDPDDADVLRALGGPVGPWRDRLPIWDWVGGRTSVTGPVGLVPMQLVGHDWRSLLEGAAAMDRATRGPPETNPAAWLAGTWFSAGNGRGDRALVVLPYRDRFALLGRYLQQLVMESIGKRLDRDGTVVHQGLTVYGNRGSTDQHAFIQQVRDGRDDSFVHFVEVTDPGAASPADGGHDAADHLLGFRLGTAAALTQSGRPSLVVRLPDASARSLGALIALFERAVGLYAELVNINAYNQPGVEAGKRAARSSLQALAQVAAALSAQPRTAHQIGEMIGMQGALVWRLCEHLAATERAHRLGSARPANDRFTAV